MAEAAVEAESKPLIGIAMKVASVCAFISMATLIKLAGQVPAGQIVFFRSFFALVPIGIYLLAAGQLREALKTSNPTGHFLRGLVGVLSMGLGFFGLTRLPLPDAVAIGHAGPLVSVVLGAVLLGETVRRYRWGAVLIGLVGVLIISWPKLQVLRVGGDTAQAVGAAATLVSAFMAALAFVMVRNLVKTDKTTTIVLYFSLSASLLALMTLPFGWQALTLMQLTSLVAAGFVGGVGQILLTESYRHADTSTIAPFDYVSVLLSVAIGIVVFSEYPTVPTIVGSVIVVCSGLFIIWREHQLGIERRRMRRAITPQG